MSVNKKLFAKITLLSFASCLLIACGSHGRNASPDYHINSMERMDKQPYCPPNKCAKHRKNQELPKDWNKDK